MRTRMFGRDGYVFTDTIFGQGEKKKYIFKGDTQRSDLQSCALYVEGHFTFTKEDGTYKIRRRWHAGQAAAWRSEKRFVVVLAGTQGGPLTRGQRDQLAGLQRLDAGGRDRADLAGAQRLQIGRAHRLQLAQDGGLVLVLPLLDLGDELRAREVRAALPLLEQAAQWTHGLRELMKPWSSGRAYQNYLDGLITAPGSACFGAQLPRLQALRAQLDPQGLFAQAQGLIQRMRRRAALLKAILCVSSMTGAPVWLAPM